MVREHVRRGGANMRLCYLCTVFALQLGMAYSVSVHAEIANQPDLHAIPARIGAWEGQQDLKLDPEVAELIRPDAFVSRNYQSLKSSANIAFLTAYFRTVEAGSGPHSPKVCLPGSGWREITNQVLEVAVPASAESVPVNEYLLEKGDRRILVVYWYQNKRHVWAEEFRAKLYALPDLIAHHRSDVALVRLVNELENAGGASLERARRSSAEFLEALYPSLKRIFAAT